MKKKKTIESETSRFANSTKTSKTKTAPNRQVVIDFPVEGEIVTSPAYACRIGVSPTDRVEVSIDGKEWLPCRESVGYWWYDWSGYNAGPHTLQARIPSTGKRFIKSSLRQFTVLI